MRHPNPTRIAALAVAMAVILSAAGCAGPFSGGVGSVEDARKAAAQALSPTVDASALVEEGTLTVGVVTDGSNVPYCVLDDDKVMGLDVDLGSVLADHMGLQVKFVVVNDASAALLGKQCDVVIRIEDDGAQGATTVGDYSQTAVALFHKGEASTSALADVSGKTVGVQGDSASQAAVEGSNLGATTKTYTNLNEAFKALDAGEVDYVACDAYSGAYLAASYDGVGLAGTLDTPTVIGVAVDSTNTALIDAVKAAWDGASQDGTYDLVRARWLGSLPKLDESTVIQGVELDEDAKTRAASVGSEGTGEGPQDGSTAGSNAVDGF